MHPVFGTLLVLATVVGSFVAAAYIIGRLTRNWYDKI